MHPLSASLSAWGGDSTAKGPGRIIRPGPFALVVSSASVSVAAEVLGRDVRGLRGLGRDAGVVGPVLGAAPGVVALTAVMGGIVGEGRLVGLADVSGLRVLRGEVVDLAAAEDVGLTRGAVGAAARKEAGEVDED